MENNHKNSNAITWITGVPLLVAAPLSLGIATYIERGEKAFHEHQVILPQITVAVLGVPKHAWCVGIIIFIALAIWISLTLKGPGVKAAVCFIAEFIILFTFGLIYLAISLPMQKIVNQLP
jgi:hypothetical protein